MQESISGGISGAITDPYSEEAEAHAELYYEEIRHFRTDINKIAENTGFTPEQIMLVKNYLFVDEHLLDGEIKRFDPSFEIAESWQRLAFDPKNIQQHDMTLLYHELMEMELIHQGYQQSEAHEITSKDYNYPKESREYYEELGYDEKQNGSSKNSGGIKTKKNWAERC